MYGRYMENKEMQTSRGVSLWHFEAAAGCVVGSRSAHVLYARDMYEKPM
jgi:hypothetical protein